MTMQTICLCVCVCASVCVSRWASGAHGIQNSIWKNRHWNQAQKSYCIKTGHAEARGSIFDIEEEEDMDEPHYAIKGTPTPGSSADVWLL